MKILYLLLAIFFSSLAAPSSDASSRTNMYGTDKIAMETNTEAFIEPAINLLAQQNIGNQVKSFVCRTSPETQIRVNLTNQRNHGVAPIGVIGFRITLDTGVIMDVYPPSDLNRFHIHPGDRVLAYLGHRFVNGEQMIEEVVGTPGTFCDITFLHDGQIITVWVNRVDARALLHYDDCSNHYHECAARTRYW